MSTASEQASRFATRRPDFEGMQEAAFKKWVHDLRAFVPDFALAKESRARLDQIGARWEQWERTHKVAA